MLSILKRILFVMLFPLVIPASIAFFCIAIIYSMIAWPIYYISTGEDFENSDWNLFPF